VRGWRGAGLVGGWQASASVCFYAVFARTAFLRAEFSLTRFRTGLAVTATIADDTLSLFAAGAVVDDEEVGAAAAGGRTAINLGGLVAPPAFGYLADTAGYALGWYALAGCAAPTAVALVPLVQV